MLDPTAIRMSIGPEPSGAVTTSCQHTTASKHNIWMLNRARYHFCQQGLFKVYVVASVILSAAKNPIPSTRDVRFAQDDKKEL